MIDEIVDKIRRRLKRKSKDEVRRIFEAHADKRKGTLDRDALSYAIEKLGLMVSDAQVDGLMAKFDDDRNGVIDFSEFSRIMLDDASDASRSRLGVADGGRSVDSAFDHYAARVGSKLRKSFKEFDRRQRHHRREGAREGREAHAAQHGPRA